MTTLAAMYTPPFNVINNEDELRAFVADARTAWFITVGADSAPVATLLPVVWRGDRVIAHMAKANAQWRSIGNSATALLIAGGAQAYVSPSWYPSKSEHGRVVPTWNYSAVHLTGTVTVHEDSEWVRAAVTDLTDTHEGDRADRWHVTDAPPHFVDGQLRGIVGIEVAVTRVEGKAKLSQNRSEADQSGVIDGLRREEPHRAGDDAVADAMAKAIGLS